MGNRSFAAGLLLVGLASLFINKLAVAQPGVPQFTFDYPDTVYTCVTEGFRLEIQDARPDYVYRWFLNGAPIAGQTSSTLVVGRTGYYRAEVSLPGGDPVMTDNVLVYLLESPETRYTNIPVCRGASLDNWRSLVTQRPCRCVGTVMASCFLKKPM